MKQDWQLAEDGNTYTRALGALEYKFWLDARFNGTADNFARVTLRLQPDFAVSQEKLDNAWTTCRQRLPMLAARIIPAEKKDDVRFAVSTEDLRQDAVRLAAQGTAEDLISQLIGPERDLDDQHQSRCFAIATSPDSLDLFFLLSHSIGDGVSSVLLARAFCDALAAEAVPTTCGKEELATVLATVPCLDSLISHQLGKRYRWQSATGKWLFHHRGETRQGGSTLPRTITDSTFNEPAVSKYATIEISTELSTPILANCKAAGLTFGSVLPVLGQVALARTLFSSQKYRGDPEWQKRLRSPWNVGGPANLRKYFQDWQGKDQVLCSIGYTDATLPPLPRPSANPERYSTFQDLLPYRQFIHRSMLVKQQYSQDFLQHPLMLAICNEFGRARTSEAERKVAVYEGTSAPQPPQEQAANPLHPDSEPFVFAHIVSTWGVLDNLLPTSYTSQDDCPLFKVADLQFYLRTRPTEFYLQSDYFQGVLRFRVQYDGRVYEEQLVKDVLEGIRDASQFYFGGTAERGA